MKPNNAMQRCTTILIEKWWRRVGSGEQEKKPLVMARIGVLGFISFSPTYQDR